MNQSQVVRIEPKKIPTCKEIEPIHYFIQQNKEQAKKLLNDLLSKYIVNPNSHGE